MSHFTVLVAANDTKELEENLLPYHEYECTGIEDYTEFVPLDMVDAHNKFVEYGEKYDYKTIEEFIPGYYGYEKNERGIWGHITNPNAQWDWWTVGGRWSGLLLLKSPAHPNRADSALASEVDWNEMREEQTEKQRARYQAWHSLPKAEEVGEEVYRKEIFDKGFVMITVDEVNDLENMNEWQYIEKYAVVRGMTYAFIDLEGRWQHRAEMGWFGLHGEEVKDYDQAWWQFVETLPSTQRVYVVDCHI